MQTITRTTVLLPEELLQQVKIRAAQDKTTVSRILREALEAKLYGEKGKKTKKLGKWLGKYKLGSTSIYQQRATLYGKHLKRKMAY